MEGVKVEGGDDEFGGKRLCDEAMMLLRMESGGAEWPMYAPNVDYGNRLGSSSMEVSGSDIRSGPGSYYGNDGCSAVEELTLNNCGVANAAALGMVEVGLRDEGLHGKRSHWQQLYKFTGSSTRQVSETVISDQGHILLNAREGLRRMSTDTQSLNVASGNCCSREPEEVSSQLMNGYNKIVFNSSLPHEVLRKKALVSPRLAQYFAEKVNKGKGVVNGEQYLRTNFVAPGTERENFKLTTDTGKLGEPSIINNSSSHNFVGSAPQQFNKHMILRKWLKPGRYKLNKIESLDIYRKILELVDGVHSQGYILGKLRPSYFNLEFPNKVKYIGPLMQTTDNTKNKGLRNKRQFADDFLARRRSSSKQQKVKEEFNPSQSRCDFVNDSESDPVADAGQFGDILKQKIAGDQTNINPTHQLSYVSLSMEELWYSSPEELNGLGCTFSSNAYALGVLFFELCCSRTPELLSASMMNLRKRVLPPTLLSEHPKEVGFCLWLLHPDASLRPSVREILESDLLCQHQKTVAAKPADVPLEDGLSHNIEVEDTESELLLHFLTTLKERKESQVSKLKQYLEFLHMDVQNVERRNVQQVSLMHPLKGSPTIQSLVHGLLSKPSNVSESKVFVKDKQLEDAYFSIRSKMQETEPGYERPDKDVLKGIDNWLQKRKENDSLYVKDNPHDELGEFFEGLCKYTTYNKLEDRGTLRSGDLHNSANVVCSMSFDRDEEFIAIAWLSKKIKIFGFDALLNVSANIHYPVAEMSNKSMLSCVCWNSYIKNYLASTDYDGTVQMWDVNTNQVFCQYSEHQKRAWSVDFSKVDPRKFASGGDDYSVKIWSINERNSTITIRNPASICCVQFSPSSPNLVAFGSADYKLYCYDFRHTRIPWCTLSDHEGIVSHVEFLDSDNVVSASTDSTLKLWDLKKTSPTGLSSRACSLTYEGHTNQKNFVGLSVSDGFIACGSETNEVFTYHKSLPIPITSYKFNSVDPISGRRASNDDSQFVSSICWRRESNMILAANSKGNIKLLKMVRGIMQSAIIEQAHT